MEYNSRLSVKIDGRYLADHADPLPAIDAFPPFKNLALGQPVSASRSLPEAPPENAVDGRLHTWVAGSHPPQWIEIDLGQPVAVALVRLVVDQYPAGATVHQIWGRGPDEALRLLHEFRGLTVSGSTLEFVPETPVAGLQFIRILTTKSPSWVAWTEIEVLGESNSDGAPDLEQSDDRGNAEDEYVASPPSGNPAPGQPVTVAPALPEAPPENPVNTQMTVQLLYPRLTGAFIELQAEPLRPGLWTRMQWQDAEGGWHNIEGWQGSFNEEQRVSWWVGEEHLGEGPFRWLVYESQAGDLLAVSQPFSLPSRGGEVLHVEVSLAAPAPEAPAAAANGSSLAEASEFTSDTQPPKPLQEENIALGKPVIVTTNGANDSRENPGIEPADITDGRLDYLAAGDALEDGVVGYVNDDFNQRMVITVTIDLQGTYDVSRIRYNMGDVQRAESWHADVMTTPLGTSPTNPGTPYHGVWTEHAGSATLSRVTVVLEKTRISYETDWLFIGEIEVYGVRAANSPLVRNRF